MELFMIGDIIAFPFPYSNLQGFKRRPALVLADNQGDDLVVCQITSQNVSDNFAVPIVPSDVSGKLFVASYIRSNKLFTIDKSVILYKIGILSDKKLYSVFRKLYELFGLK